MAPDETRDGEVPDAGSATVLLRRVGEGDASARASLFDLVYGELHRLARGHMRHQAPAHTLQPTALVHEAWMRLVDPDAAWKDREHFLSVASRAMRSVLVDHARRRGAKKRGGELARIPLDQALDLYQERAQDLVGLDAALEKLFSEDAELGRVVELRFFGGLAMPEVAKVIGASLSTAERQWRLARAWLRAELDADSPQA